MGVPLTLAQLEALTPPVLVARLINARRHLLALRVAEMLGMDTDKVGSQPVFYVSTNSCPLATMKFGPIARADIHVAYLQCTCNAMLQNNGS